MVPHRGEELKRPPHPPATVREQQPLPGVLPDPSGADFTVSSDPSPGFHTTAVMDGPRRSPGTPAPYTTKEVAYPCERQVGRSAAASKALGRDEVN
ncbi:hypothetical protein VTH82DRAFT_2095 [Thermothelomyces myriococcoides]